MSNEERIPGANYVDQIYLREGGRGLELALDTGDDEVSIILNPHNVRELRLALARYERRQAAK